MFSIISYLYCIFGLINSPMFWPACPNKYYHKTGKLAISKEGRGNHKRRAKMIFWREIQCWIEDWNCCEKNVRDTLNHVLYCASSLLSKVAMKWICTEDVCLAVWLVLCSDINILSSLQIIWLRHHTQAHMHMNTCMLTHTGMNTPHQVAFLYCHLLIIISTEARHVQWVERVFEEWHGILLPIAKQQQF